MQIRMQNIHCVAMIGSIINISRSLSNSISITTSSHVCHFVFTAHSLLGIRIRLRLSLRLRLFHDIDARGLTVLNDER